MLDEQYKDLKQDIREIKSELVETRIETNAQLARYNGLLEVHIEGVKTLKKELDLIEMRIEPVEDHVRFLAKLFKIAGWALGAASAFLGIWKYYS